MKRYPGFCAALIMLAVMFTISASAQITPSDDSYILTSSPKTNFGAKNILVVQGPGATTFVRFDLSSLPSGLTSASLAKATLKVYVSAVTDGGTFDVDRVTSAWTESTITANSEPTIGAAITSAVPVSTSDKNQYVLVDVTAAVGEWLNGTTNNGVALVPDGTVSLSLNSKETTTTSHPPELDIVLNGPPGPQGQQGPPGPISGVTAGAGLTGGGTKGTVTLSMLTSCASGQSLEWTGSTWACASGLNTVTHDTSLAGNGTTSTPLVVTVPMSLTNTTSVATITGANTGSGAGVVGSSTATQGVVGQNSNSFPAVEGANAGVGDGVLGLNLGATGFGVRGFSGSGSGLPSNPAGVIGDSKTQVGVVGLSSATAGVAGVSNSANGVQGSNPGTVLNTAGVYGTAGNASGLSGIAGVWGNSQNNVGAYGTSTNSAGVEGASVNANGVYGLATNVHAIGVFGQNGAPSANGGSVNLFAGVRGDGGTVGDIGVIGSSDNAPAGYFTSNIGAGGLGFALISEVFDNAAGWPFIARNDANASSCNVDNHGNLNCTGAKHAVVPIDGGARRVALSAIESPQNWFEDFGSGQLAGGSTVVTLDSDFTQTVNTALAYHVFLTPNGDCKGLYVSNRTAASFEVGELGGGSSSVAFSYRIVALRKNYENIRLEDRTNDPDPMKFMGRRGQQADPQSTLEPVNESVLARGAAK